MIGFVGAGKVGVSLSAFFKANCIDISGFYSKNISSAEYAASLTDSKVLSLSELVNSSDIIFVTVPDSVIAEIDLLLSDNFKEFLKDKILVHCSGALSSSEGFRLSGKICSCASIHPMMAFNSKTTDFENIQNCFYTVEGDENALKTVQNLLTRLKLSFKRISSENKAAYHLASVLNSNCMAALFYMGQRLLHECGFNETESRLALSLLMKKNADNIGSCGVYDALTGPVIRNDAVTVSKHLQTLNQNDKKLYAMLSLKLSQIAKIKRPDTDYRELTALLNKEISDESNRGNI